MVRIVKQSKGERATIKKLATEEYNRHIQSHRHTCRLSTDSDNRSDNGLLYCHIHPYPYNVHMECCSQFHKCTRYILKKNHWDINTLTIK